MYLDAFHQMQKKSIKKLWYPSSADWKLDFWVVVEQQLCSCRTEQTLCSIWLWSTFWTKVFLLLSCILILHTFLVLSFLLVQESINYCQEKFGSTSMPFGFPLLPGLLDKSLHLSASLHAVVSILSVSMSWTRCQPAVTICVCLIRSWREFLFSCLLFSLSHSLSLFTLVQKQTLPFDLAATVAKSSAILSLRTKKEKIINYCSVL